RDVVELRPAYGARRRSGDAAVAERILERGRRQEIVVLVVALGIGRVDSQVDDVHRGPFPPQPDFPAEGAVITLDQGEHVEALLLERSEAAVGRLEILERAD